MKHFDFILKILWALACIVDWFLLKNPDFRMEGRYLLIALISLMFGYFVRGLVDAIDDNTEKNEEKCNEN